MSALADRIAAEYAATAPALPPAQAARRRQALQTLLARGLPGVRDENWRYANLRALEKARFAPLPGGTVEPQSLPAPIAGWVRHVFVDGVYAPELSGAEAGPGFTLRTGAAARDDLPRSAAADVTTPATAATAAPATASPVTAASATTASATAAAAATARTAAGRQGAPAPAHRDDSFALLNEAFAADAALLEVTGVDVQVELVFVAQAEAAQGSSYPRLQVRLAPNTRARLIERHVAAAEAASCVDSAVSVDLGEAAQLTHLRLQQWLDTLAARVGRDAAYRLHLLTLGAQSSRSTGAVRLAGPGARLDVDAVALAGGSAVHDQVLQVEHLAPHTRTAENFRGIASGRARIAFNGKVVVHEAAANADSAQSLRGLLAGEEAEIDLRPQLEINTDEVRASHGATAGKLDDTMLFYLLARGLDREEARRLLEWAFIADLVAKIDVPELRRDIERSLARRMHAPLEA